MNAAPILIGKGQKHVYLLPQFANRHGLIAGATGTGKTVTLQILAEGFSRLGVPVFTADVKGDVSGISQPGRPHPKIDERVRKIGIEDFAFEGMPVIFWDLFGQQGHPIRTTVSEMGPLLLSRLMGLNDTQEGVLNIVFKLADDEGLLLLDLKDLRALLQHVGERRKELSLAYGNISPASVGAIQRRLLVLEEQGGEHFFGEPALDIRDFMRTTPEGRGYINILAADRLMQNPRLYSTFLLWLLAELFEELPEVGDVEKPRMVFFFDEAHLLFSEAPKALMEKIEQVVKLIRSKGIGIYFVTQNPLDIPNDVLAQLGNRIQHALRAYTPMERRAVRAAAQAFRPNPAFDTEAVITQLGVGEALVSTLDEKGAPSMVEHTLVRPPTSRIGPATEDERRAVISKSPLYGQYEKTIDRRSAYEILVERAQQRIEAAEAAEREEDVTETRRTARTSRRRGRRRESATTSFFKSVARAMGSSLGRSIIRGLLGSFTRRR